MPPKPRRIAVDTNVLMDIAVPKNAATDAVDLLREHFPDCVLIVVPTVIQELVFFRSKDPRSKLRGI